jgi:hypothetical protein
MKQSAKDYIDSLEFINEKVQSPVLIYEFMNLGI